MGHVQCFEPNDSLSIQLRQDNEFFRASLGKGESDWNETSIWHSSPGRLPGGSTVAQSSELRVTNQHPLIPQDRIPTETQIFHTPQARDKDSSILASHFPREQIEKHSSPKQRLRA